MGHVFVSYARLNMRKVDLVVKQLEHAGVKIWIDRSMNPGEIVPDEIAEAIIASEKFSLFLTPASVASPYVLRELHLALAKKIPIIPIILIATEIHPSLELQIGNIEHIDLSKNFIKGLEDLLKTLGDINLPKGYEKHLLSYLPSTYVTPELISPLPNPSKEVVVGKTINIKQIRDQRFMPRSKVLANAIHELGLQINEREKRKEDEIFTFWIHGRSGSGKSVLLLQVMQEMILNRHAQAFWFYSDENEKLYDFFENWAEQAVELTEPLFVFTDDFNTPLTRDLIENKSISSLLRNPAYSDVNWPVIVTCSPPEYLEDFRNGGKDEGFRIRDWEIPTIDAEESKQLIQWFEARTGKKSKIGKAFEQSEGLALSMLFELWYNAHYQDADKNEDVMKAFGLRFKTRLDALNLTEAIAPILALNRLYIWPPNSWLEEMAANQRDAFNVLISDKDFSILSIKPSPSGFVRLTHPHLSDVIYQTIRPKNANRITRAYDLANSFEKALTTNVLIASQILRIVSENINNERSRLASDEIDVDELAKLFTKTWIEQKAIDDQTRGLLIYAWINWVVWNSKNPKISIYLNERNIVEKSLHYLGNQHKLWGELWHKLWTCEPKNKYLIQSAAKWLRQHQNGSGWSYVWRALLEHPDTLPEGVSIQSLLQLGTQWLNGRKDKDQWAFVWRALLEHPQALPQDTSVHSLIQLGLQWLNGREDKDPWSFVWRALLDHPQALPQDTSIHSLIQLGLQWLTSREDKDQWSFVWQTLFRHSNLPSVEKDKLLILGVNWLHKFLDTGDWNFIWKDILAYSQMFAKELVGLGSKWLSLRGDHDQWAFVWQILLQHPEALPQDTSVHSLIQLGAHWLTGREDKDPWSFVWQTLLQHPEALPQDTSVHSLIQLGAHWLTSREDKDGWGFVWQILLQHPDDLPEGTSVQSLIQLGLQWLNGREDKDQWDFVWQTLLQHPEALPQDTSVHSLIQLGLQWLTGREDKDGWGFVWQILLQHPDELLEGTSSLIKKGVQWLYTNIDKNPWGYVFEKCIQNHALESGFLSLGVNWTLVNTHRPETLGIGFQLAKFPDKIPPAEKYRLQKWVKDWVYETNYTDKRWTYGWAAYWSLMPTIETMEIALKWIVVNPENVNGAIWIIKELLRENRYDVDNKLRKWHENHSDQPVSEIIRKKLGI